MTGARRGSKPAGAALSLQGLVKDYDGRPVVRGIDLEIHSGEFLTLLGPSGSGKSTTLMMIAGFETPSSGDITLDGRSIVGVPPYRRNLGMVFQNYALFPHLSVADNIGFPLRQRGMPAAERAKHVDAALELVHLEGYGKRYPRQLSGGQQQRVALARAIVFKPQLLLLDEPLGALDKQLRESLQMELRRLHADLGITFIFVTHDQEEALTMSDRIAVLNDGVIAQLGAPQELYDRPANRFVAAFLGESNFIPGVALGMEADYVIARCGEATIRALASRQITAGEDVLLTTRPERMRFASNPANGAGGDLPLNRMEAVVTESVFAGERSRYACAVQDMTIWVKQPSGASVRAPSRGEPVELVWPAADTVIV